MTDPIDAPSRDRSVLEEEREFFLRSLRDLDVEHGVGDIDDVDYRSLRDDYTVRAADVVRRLAALDAPTPSPVPAPPPPVPTTAPAPAVPMPAGAADDATPSGAGATAGPPSSVATRPVWRQRRFLLAAVLIVAAGVAWAVVGLTRGSETTAQRVAGLQVAAQAAINRGDAIGAITTYNQALRLDPTDPVSLTGEGIVYVGASGGRPGALLRQGETELQRAEIADPSYFPAYGWRGIALYDLGQYRSAIPQLETYLAEAPKSLQNERQTVMKGLADARQKLAVATG